MRYFRMKADTPREFSHAATAVPSLSIASLRYAPPGQMITAVPFLVASGARATVSVGV